MSDFFLVDFYTTCSHCQHLNNNSNNNPRSRSSNKRPAVRRCSVNMVMANVLLFLIFVMSLTPSVVNADNPCTFAVPAGCTTDCAYLAFWNVDPVRGKIRFSISHSITQPNTWSGIAFNTRPSMIGADVVVGWVETDGRAVLIDATANNYGQPQEDFMQNIEDQYVSMIDTQQVIEFTRPLHPTDPSDINYPGNGSCPYFIFPISGGAFKPGTRNYTKHFDDPLIFGPVCPSVCAVPEFAQRVGTCAGDAVINRFVNVSVESCSAKCLVDLSCQAFDFAADSSTCLLRSAACLSQTLDTTSQSRFTYEKMTRHDFTRTTGECFGNEVFGQQQITTLQRCALACNTLSNCQAFTYNPFTNECSPQTVACQDARGSVVSFVYTKIFDQGQKADIFFTFDLSSATTSSADFDLVKQFLAQFIQLSSVGPNAFLVGGMTYSCIDGPQSVISLNSYVDKKPLIQAMMSFPYADLSTNRALAEKIRYSRSHAFTQSVGNRPDALNYVVVISQCPLNDTLASMYESNAAKEDGINVVVVCIGKITDWESVRDVSNIPNGVINPISFRGMVDGVAAKQLYDLIIMPGRDKSEKMGDSIAKGADSLVGRRNAFHYPIGAFDFDSTVLNDPFPAPSYYSVVYEECQGPECNLLSTGAAASPRSATSDTQPTLLPFSTNSTQQPQGPYSSAVSRDSASSLPTSISSDFASIFTSGGISSRFTSSATSASTSSRFTSPGSTSGSTSRFTPVFTSGITPGSSPASATSAPTSVSTQTTPTARTLPATGSTASSTTSGSTASSTSGTASTADNLDTKSTAQPDSGSSSVVEEVIPALSICFGDRGSLICGFNQQITAVSAHFGRTGYETETTCQTPNPVDCGGEEIDCSAFDVYSYVSQVCAGKSACELKMNSWTLAAMSEQCPGLQNCSVCQQYLQVAYLCTGQKCINNDLYMMLDFSRDSVSPTDISIFREFSQMFIRKLGISPLENQAGIYYQSSGPVFRPLKANPTPQDLLDFVSSISYNSLASSSSSQSFRVSLDTLTTDGFSPVSGGRSGANRIVMIFTTTKQSGNLRDTADRLRVAGITPVFIALGPNPVYQTVTDLGIATPATMFLTNFSALTNVDVLDSLISKVLCQQTGGGGQGCDEQVDLVFGLVFAQTLISRESFDKLKVFLKEAANYFNVQSDKVRIGIFQHDMFPEYVINLRSGASRDVLVQQIDQLEYFRYGVNGADIPLSIQYSRTHAYTLAAGGRPGVRKILVLMTTRDPSDAEATKFEVQTGNRELGLDIIAVGIGGQVSSTGLLSVATRPTGVVLVGSTTPAELRQPVMNAYTSYTCRSGGDSSGSDSDRGSLGDRVSQLANLPQSAQMTVHSCSILQGRVHMTYKDGYIRDPTEFKNPTMASNYTGQIAASAGYCTREQCDPVGCRQGWQPLGGRNYRAYSCLPEFASFSASNDQSWCPYFCADSVYKPYLQLDMGGFYDVAGLLFQGRKRYEHWVTKFAIMYSTDGNQWQFVSESGRFKVFEANENSREIIMLNLGGLQFRARYIRLIVVEFHGIPAMHVDVLRCPGESECPAISVKNSNIDHQPAVRSSSITVTCNDEWMTAFGETSYQLNCDVGGVWSQIKHCSEPRECRGFPFVEYAVHNGRNLRVGSTVTYTCLGKRTLVGNATVMCQLDRDFSTPPTCQELPIS